MGYQLKAPILASRLGGAISLHLMGNDRFIASVAAMSDHSAADLTFSSRSVGEVAGVAVVPEAAVDGFTTWKQGALFVSPQPRIDFARALTYLEEEVGFADPPESVVHPSAVIGQNVVIEKGCVIDEGCVVEHNVVLHAGTRLGRGTRVRAGAVIGGDGFGFVRLPDETLLRFPHLGGVQIGPDVEVGSNSTISRGTLSDTVVSEGAKLSNLVHIAHNCHVGANAIVTVGTALSGGTIIGRNVWLGPNACTREKVRIGDDACIGIGAVVITDVPGATVYAGNPATRLRKTDA